MQYMLLIYNDEKTLGPIPAGTPIMPEYERFTKDIIAAGQFRAGDRLQPVSTATTVRVREGKTMTTHGPFAETREQLGGYYVVEAKDLDEAVEIAARIPGARMGSIEVRPVYPMPPR